jgi:hypothetical protein
VSRLLLHASALPRAAPQTSLGRRPWLTQGQQGVPLAQLQLPEAGVVLDGLPACGLRPCELPLRGVRMPERGLKLPQLDQGLRAVAVRNMHVGVGGVPLLCCRKHGVEGGCCGQGVARSQELDARLRSIDSAR